MTQLKTCILLCLLFFASSLQASENWAIYLFNDESHEIVKVYEDGSTENYLIELDDNEEMRGIVFASPYTEDLIAYCTAIEDGDTFEMSFKLLNLASNEILNYANVWPTDDCYVHDFSLEAVIFTQVVHSYDGTHGIDFDWNVIVMDIASGEIVGQLSPASPQIDEEIAEVLFNEDGTLGAIEPRPFFDGNQLFFLLDDYDEGVGLYAFEWDIAENRLSMIENPLQGSMNYLPSTGERTYIDGQTLYIRDAEDNEQVLFEDSEWQPITSFFLNNGQVLGVFLTPADSDDVTIRYLILDRDGNQAEYIFPDGVFGTIHSAPEGVAALISTYEGSGVTSYQLELLRLADNERRVIWEDDDGPFWYVIGTVGDALEQDLAPFPNSQ